MKRETLEKLDQVLSKLEGIAALTHPDLEEQPLDEEALHKAALSAIEILDEIVPRPLPPDFKDKNLHTIIF